MKVLVGCEFSGTVREAFNKRGHDAWSCDLLPSAISDNRHIIGNVLDILDHGWDLAIFHPPCTYLCSSGLHWNCRTPGRAQKTREAIAFVEHLWDAPVPRIAIENPRGCLSTFSKLMRETQAIQPWSFGHDASKETLLWLENLPPLRPGRFVAPRLVNGKERWSNQTDSGQNRLPPSDDRWALRSITYQGIADAMAEQWGAA